MKYKDELIRSMEWLAEKEDTTFIGQSVAYSGNAIYNTLKTIDIDKRIEVPVFEEVQMGMCTGMAMNGIVPICCFPRFDFILRCMDALVNHLDKMQHMTEGTFKPKVIMRTSIGSTDPLNGGVQHTQDYTDPIKRMLHEVNVVLLNEPEQIFPEFEEAYNTDCSTLLIEWGDYYNEK
jgi:pyruvate/2-oxoglutarate/acetoin dehydrogenase E1 component|tara:strand:- start:33 stop:563 length:531 start_codon:yes stop_codon:yes gene_type:complete